MTGARRDDAQAPVPQLRMDPEEWLGLGGCTLVVAFIGLAVLGPVLLGPEPVGAAISLGLPFALGGVSGLLVRDRRMLAMVGLCWAAIGVVIGGLLARHEAGIFCSAVYAVAAFGPGMFAGLLTMYWRRRRRHRRDRARLDAFLLLVVVLLPFGLHLQERWWPPRHAGESLAFACEIDAPCECVFAQSLAFADASLSPWAALGAPLPHRAEGRATAVGDVKTLHFAHGLLTVRVTRVEPGRLLAGEVVEQTIERKALWLRSVTVTCEPLGAQRTRAAVRIDFEPRMGPRWYWRPFEHWFGGIAFTAVLDAWRRGSEAPAPAPNR